MDVCKKKVKPKNGVQKCNEISEHICDDLNKNCWEIIIFIQQRRVLRINPGFTNEKINFWRKKFLIFVM